MRGLSSEVLFASSGAVVALTIALVIWLESRSRAPAVEPAPSRVDLLRYRAMAALLHWRPFPFVARAPFVLIFLLIIVAGFLGSQTMGSNVAPVLTWTIWWAFLIIVIPFLGKTWCLVCPWNAIAEWIQRFSLWRVRPTTISLGFHWPKALRNLYPAIVLFIVLSWLELGMGVTTSAAATAGLGVVILILAVLPALYYDRKPFCRYVCPVGMVSGAYAQMAALEVRSRDREVCRACRTKDCVNGNEAGYGCPVSAYPGMMDRDTYCIQCMECIKACPRGNMTLNLRGFASSVISPAKLRVDEAIMVIVVFGLTFFHSASMTPNWADAVHGVHAALGGGTWALPLGFTVGMLVIVAVPALVYLVGVAAAKGANADGLSLGSAFVGFAYVLLPVALFYHLAHNLEHLLREGQRVVPVLSDPLGRGWNLFGTAWLQLGPLAPLEWIQIVQAVLVVMGQAYGVYMAYRVTTGWGIGDGGRLRAALPLVAVVLVLSLANLWLLSMPMQMRMGDGTQGMAGM